VINVLTNLVGSTDFPTVTIDRTGCSRMTSVTFKVIHRTEGHEHFVVIGWLQNLNDIVIQAVGPSAGVLGLIIVETVSKDLQARKPTKLVYRHSVSGKQNGKKRDSEEIHRDSQEFEDRAADSVELSAPWICLTSVCARFPRRFVVHRGKSSHEKSFFQDGSGSSILFLRQTLLMLLFRAIKMTKICASSKKMGAN
jgi:hypothetical protein